MREEEKKGILLESGTNEIEIMEFTIDGNLYGINVAKDLIDSGKALDTMNRFIELSNK